MAAGETTFRIRLATSTGKPVLASVLADSLAGAQEALFQLGEQRLGRSPRTSGSPTKEVRNAFSLRVEKLETGSAILTLSLPRPQAKLDASPPEAKLAIEDFDAIAELIAAPAATADQAAFVVPDPQRRRAVARAMKRMVPTASGHYLEVTRGVRSFKLSGDDRPAIDRLMIEEETEPTEDICGRITGLHVDKGRTFVVDTEHGKKTVHYDSDLESTIRDCLGGVSRISVTQMGRELYVASDSAFELLEGLPLDSFVLQQGKASGQVDPPLSLEIQLEGEGETEYYVGSVQEFDILVTGKDVAGLASAAKDSLGELWEIYVAARESDLTAQAKELRHALMGRLNF